MPSEPTKRCPRCRTENPPEQVICKGFGCCYVFNQALVNVDPTPVALIGRTYPAGTVRW